MGLNSSTNKYRNFDQTTRDRRKSYPQYRARSNDYQKHWNDSNLYKNTTKNCYMKINEEKYQSPSGSGKVFHQKRVEYYQQEKSHQKWSNASGKGAIETATVGGGSTRKEQKQTAFHESMKLRVNNNGRMGGTRRTTTMGEPLSNFIPRHI